MVLSPSQISYHVQFFSSNIKIHPFIILEKTEIYISKYIRYNI